MSTTYANGIFNSESFGAQSKQSFSNTLFTKYPNGTAPLLAMTSQLQRESATNTVHTWGADSMPMYVAKLSSPLLAAVAGTAETLNVTDTNSIIPKTTWLIPGTDEQVYVETVLSSTQIVVRRGFGSSPATAAPAGASLVKLGNAQAESSLRPSAQSNFSYAMDNQTQILRDSYAMSGTAQAIEEMLRGTGGSFDRLKKNEKDAALEHARSIERSLIFGQRTLSHQDGQPLRTMDGALALIKKYAPSNIKTLGQTTTFKQLSKALEPMVAFSTDPSTTSTRLLLTGNTGFSFLNDMGRSVTNVTFNQNQNSFGMRFTSFMTDFGDFKVMTHPLFNTVPEWSQMMLVLDLPTMRTAYLGGRDTRLMRYNDQGQAANTASSDSNGMDAAMGTFLTEMTLVMGVPDANGIVNGACSVACDPCLPSAPGYSAEFCISHPCEAGAVNPGDSIFLEIKHAKPTETYSIVTPTGTVSITTDANGDGSVQYTFAVDAAPSTYLFVVPQGSGAAYNTTWTGSVQTACIVACDPCDVKVVTQQGEPSAC